LLSSSAASFGISHFPSEYLFTMLFRFSKCFLGIDSLIFFSSPANEAFISMVVP
jgi:hypothetical protein